MTFPKKPVNTGGRTITEDQAITRLKQGDLSGLEVIVQRYQVKAVHAAILIVRDRETAEEIVQNAFFQAAQRIHQFDDRRPFGPWFLRSVINAALQEPTRRGKEGRMRTNSSVFFLDHLFSKKYKVGENSLT